MPDYHYTHPVLWLVASIPVWLMVWLLWKVEPTRYTVVWTYGKGYVWREVKGDAFYTYPE